MSSALRRYAPWVALFGAVLVTAGLLFAPGIATALGVVATWVLAIGSWIGSNWPVAERYGGRALAFAGSLHDGIDRTASAAIVQGVINGGRGGIEKELPGLMPEPARVKFVKSEDDLVHVSDGEVIVALQPSRNHAANTARATLAYVSSATARSARPYLDSKAMRSIDYTLTRRILGESDKTAVDYLLNSLWVPAIRSDRRLGHMCHMVQAIEDEGWLTRILLREYIDLGRRLYPRIPPPLSQESTAAFVGHLYALATRKRGERLGSGLSFRQGPLKVGIVFVAATETARSMGLVPHIRRCIANARAGCDSVYLLALGEHKHQIRRIIEQLAARGLIKHVEETEYSVKRDTRVLAATMARLSFTERAHGAGSSTSSRSGWRKGSRRQRNSRRSSAA